jgi:hypothetical protein
MRIEPAESGGTLVLYKIRKVSKEHKTVCDDALVSGQWFTREGNTHTLSKHVWDDLVACELTYVPYEQEYHRKGKLTNHGNKSVVLEIDTEALHEQMKAEQAAADAEEAARDEEKQSKLLDGIPDQQ